MSATGIIFDLRRYCIHDGPGIRTTVFFKGCPLDCWWCHNPESRSPEPETMPGRSRSERNSPTPGRPAETIGCEVTTERVMAEIVRDEIFYDESGGGATFSGGEPMMQIDFLTTLLEACRRRGIRTAVDTCGHAPEKDFDRVYDLVDLFLFDLKIMDRALHQKYTGVSNELIHSNLAFLASRGSKVVVRVPMIPGITDTEENLSAICSFLEPYGNARRISLLPYNKLGADKSERYGLASRAPGWETQSAEEILRRKMLFESRGFSVTVGG